MVFLINFFLYFTENLFRATLLERCDKLQRNGASGTGLGGAGGGTEQQQQQQMLKQFQMVRFYLLVPFTVRA